MCHSSHGLPHDGTEDHHEVGSPPGARNGERGSVSGGATVSFIDASFSLHSVDPKGVG